ncbi:MAG TPA: hypothetical protein VMJ10_00410 [Kofleriaceae bacterium]|nr:hypothetical protein [Kofleriaceae bacterium]
MKLTWAVALCACSGGGDDKLDVRISGEQLVERGMPAAMFADGWAVHFDHLVVSIGDVEARTGTQRSSLAVDRAVELAQPGAANGLALGALEAVDTPFDHVAYTLASVWIRATATKADDVRHLDLRFTRALTYDCALVGAPRALTATLHVDHLFLDNTEDENLRFQKIADADGVLGAADGTVDDDELAATRIDGDPLYRVHSTLDFDGHPITTLRQYLARRIGSFGHVNGDDPCKAIE